MATAVAFEMNKTFASVLTQQMDAFNAGPGPRAEAGARDSGLEGRTGGAGADKIEKVRGEIEEVKQVMTDNIDRILERGDKIELLVDKSLDLSEQVQTARCWRPASFQYQSVVPTDPVRQSWPRGTGSVGRGAQGQ